MDIIPELGLSDETTAAPKTAAEPQAVLGADEELRQLLFFRVGREQFAVALTAVDEAVDLTPVQPVPDMPDAMLGVCDVRGVLVPVYSPARALGAMAVAPRPEESVVLLMRAGGRRVGVVVDDVEDVLSLAPRSLLQPVLASAGDGVVLGVARVGRLMATVVDPVALLAACSITHTAAEADGGDAAHAEDAADIDASGESFTEVA
jgi:purine-binding chemotaxis protein CheW